MIVMIVETSSTKTQRLSWLLKRVQKLNTKIVMVVEKCSTKTQKDCNDCWKKFSKHKEIVSTVKKVLRTRNIPLILSSVWCVLLTSTPYSTYFALQRHTAKMTIFDILMIFNELFEKVGVFIRQWIWYCFKVLW